MAPNQSARLPGFGDDDISGAEALVQRNEFARIVGLACDHGKDSQVAAANGFEK